MWLQTARPDALRLSVTKPALAFRRHLARVDRRQFGERTPPPMRTCPPTAGWLKPHSMDEGTVGPSAS